MADDLTLVQCPEENFSGSTSWKPAGSEAVAGALGEDT